MPKVSVIMGIYNTNNREMVKEAIDSILNQTFKDFEFIICDDGSTDNTYEVVKELIQDDDRCVLIRNEFNQGLAQTLNNCLAISKGEYIARMDADDISIETRLEDEVNFLDNHSDYVLVGGNCKLFDNQGVYGIKKLVEKPQRTDLLFGPPFIHPSIMIRKKTLNNLHGYRACKETLRAEDYDLWMRLYASGEKGYNLQKAIYLFREDKNAFKRRKYKFRIDEAKVRYKGFKSLDLLPIGYIYILKPLLVGLIPQRVLTKFRKIERV